MVRKINLAKEANRMVDLLAEVFQYPDHPEWNAEEESIREVQQRARAYRRMSPILSLFPSYKNRIQGLAYDVKGEPVGLSIFYETSPQTWHIDYIGVLSKHRKQGIGTALVNATLDCIRELAGSYVSLNVAEGNVPAENLYTQAGFEVITQRLIFELQRGETISPVPSNSRYQMDVSTKKNWETQYDVAKAVIPNAITAHQPVTPDHYKPGRFALLGKILNRLAGREFKFISLREKDTFAGWALLNISKKGRDVNAVEIMSVADDDVADYLLKFSLNIMTETNSASTIIMLDSWQTSLTKAATPLLHLKKTSIHLGRAL